MRFAYRLYDAGDRPDDQSGEILRPALKVLVAGASGTRKVPPWGRIDTGADDCILPFAVAEQIVPLWYDGTYFTTGFRGDLKQAEYGGVNLQIRFKDRLVRWPAIVVFDPKREEALWGLAGFLEHFRVTFDGPGKHFTVRFPAPAPPGFDVELIPKRRRRGRKNDTVPRDEPPITPDEQDPVTADDGS